MICENRVQNVVFIPSLTHYSLLLKPLNVAALDFVGSIPPHFERLLRWH